LQRSLRPSATSEFREGWRILLGATLGVTVGIGALPFYSFGLFMRAIETEEHWTRAAIAIAQSSWAIALAIASPFLGALIDRLGFRGPVAFSLLSVAGGFYLLGSVVDSPLSFALIYGVMAAAGAASSPLPFAKLISAHFHASRGMALGTMLTGTGVAALIASWVLGPTIQSAGWRGGYVCLCLITGVLSPISLFLIGENQVIIEHAAEEPEEGGDLKSAFRSLRFWHLAGIFFLLTIGTSGLVAHLVPILVEAGVSPARAALIVGIVGISVMISRLAIGRLLDIFPVNRVAGIALTMTAFGCFSLLQYGSKWSGCAAIGVGVALGTEIDLMGFCTGRYFGIRRYGTIYGALYGCTILGVAASPVWMAVMAQAFGYRLVLETTILIVAIAATLGLFLPRTPADSAHLEDLTKVGMSPDDAK
jgi:MFS family permease